MSAAPDRHTKVNSEQKILDAALALFAERGFAATGIRHIADAVGITSAALYHYARTKDDLLLRILRTGLEDLLSSGQAAIANVKDPAERVRRLVAVHIDYGASNPARARVIDNEWQWLDDAGRQSIVALRDDYEALWGGAINEGIEAGAFTVAQPSLARLALLEMCNGPGHWYRPAGPASLSDIIAAFQDMALALLEGPPTEQVSLPRAATRASPSSKFMAGAGTTH